MPNPGLEQRVAPGMRVSLLPVSVNTAPDGRTAGWQALACKLPTTLHYRLLKEYAFQRRGRAGRMAQQAKVFVACLTAGFSSWKPHEATAVVVHSYWKTTGRQGSHLEITSQLILEYMVKHRQEALPQQGGKRTNSQKCVL